MLFLHYQISLRIFQLVRVVDRAFASLVLDFTMNINVPKPIPASCHASCKINCCILLHSYACTPLGN